MLDILVVDDHPLFRAGLERLLDMTPDLRVVGSAADGLGALRLTRELRPDAVLMDLSMPGMDGFEATSALRGLPQPPTVVVLTTSCAAALVHQAFEAGASGYLVKDMSADRLLGALLGLAEGRPAIDPRAARVLVRQRRRAEEAAALLSSAAQPASQV